MFDDMKLNEFIDELSSNSPAPGGGSVAALCSSLASALGSMVFNLTIGKKVYAQYDEEIKQKINNSLNECECYKKEFLRLMNEDADSFLDVIKAFKLPKSNQDEKKIRSSKIQEGYKKAITVPITVARKSYQIYKLIEVACMYGNKNAVSDAGVAAILIQSAIEGAVLNVRINLSSIKDEEFKKNIQQECDKLISDGLNKKESIIKVVNNKI